jgi:periplasmic protein TonB
MKIGYLLVMTALLNSGPSFGADNASAQSNAAADVLAVQAKTKPKSKAKPSAKMTKKAAAKAKTPGKRSAAAASDADPAAIAAATDLYKKALAEKIAEARPGKVYGERPQALLRSVVVLEFLVAADGKLLKSAVRRSNHDHATEATALASLRHAAPLPKPPAVLVRHGPVKLQETWLFNKDGRFQIRSTAQQQVNR